MTHFMEINILDHRSVSIPCGCDPIYFPPNLVYFAARIVDKLWQVSSFSCPLRLSRFRGSTFMSHFEYVFHNGLTDSGQADPAIITWIVRFSILAMRFLLIEDCSSLFSG